MEEEVVGDWVSLLVEVEMKGELLMPEEDLEGTKGRQYELLVETLLDVN